MTLEGDDLALSWDTPDDADVATALAALPQVEINGLQLPAQLTGLELRAPEAVANARAANNALPFATALQITQLDSKPLHSLSAAPSNSSVAILSTDNQADLQGKLDQLPTAPVFVLRQALMRGHVIAVVAVSPVFVQDGAVHVATHLQVRLNQVRLITPQVITELMHAPAAQSAAQSTVARATTSRAASPQAETGQTIWRLTVAQGGIQRITGQMLSDVGMRLAGVTPNYIHVRRQGVDVALDMRGFKDGTFDPGDEIRFYAPPPGDRWNATDAYFLGVESTPAPPMAARSVSAASASTPLTLRNTAMQRGTWQPNTHYDALQPGADADHWFASQLITPAKNNAVDNLTIDFASSLMSALPLAAGPVSITVFGTSASDVAHAFNVRMGAALGQSPSDGSFRGAGNWAHSFSLSDNQPALNLQLVSPTDDAYLLNAVTFERPVQLNFAGQSGDFWSVVGGWAYQLDGVPAQATLYDLTDIAAPVVLTNVANNQIYDDAANSSSRHYWVSGGNLAQPAITPESAARVTDIERLAGIEQIYIVPRALLPQLTPLLTFRQSQHQLVQAIDVESIYNTWSGGQISPTAIREFIRYALGQNPALKAVTLVGDGSNDPRNFLGAGNPTLIPPYLAMVDPWVGETACDTCYAQIDGDDPTADWLPDVLIGRLPVKSAAELTQVVNKIIAYETAPLEGWNWRSGHLADNYQEANGQPDAAGNFPVYQDAAVRLQPPEVEVRRVYFDPYLPSNDAPWREANPLQVHQNAINLFNQGAAIINFQGHGYFDRLGQTATVNGSPVSYLLQSDDVAQLNNGTKLPMVIEMACWTGAFHQPLSNGATIDELLVLAPNGGAIATWGSTGWGVAYQHEYLQKGAYAALWATPQMDATVGDVVQGGLVTLFTEAACCMDALYTYALLGDPMTVLHAYIPTRTFLPGAMK